MVLGDLIRHAEMLVLGLLAYVGGASEEKKNGSECRVSAGSRGARQTGYIVGACSRADNPNDRIGDTTGIAFLKNVA